MNYTVQRGRYAPCSLRDDVILYLLAKHFKMAAVLASRQAHCIRLLALRTAQRSTNQPTRLTITFSTSRLTRRHVTVTGLPPLISRPGENSARWKYPSSLYRLQGWFMGTVGSLLL